MNQTFKFFTDTATLAVFDPESLAHRVNDDADWWCDDLIDLDEIQSGTIALFSLGGDGVYQTRVTTGKLDDDERDYAAELIANLGVVVTSGKLFVGPGECLPGGDMPFDPSDSEHGTLIAIENGQYFVDVYSIHWFDSPRWWTEDNVPPDDAPVDYVVLLRPRTTPGAPIDSEPRFDGFDGEFLFASSTRTVGPQPGMILTTRVRKGPDGLTLKDCGPCNYQASLIDYSNAAWKDTIRFKVLTVDHEAQTMTGEYVETVVDT